MANGAKRITTKAAADGTPAPGYIKSTINLDAATDEKLHKIHALEAQAEGGKKVPFGRWLAERALEATDPKERKAIVARRVRAETNPDSAETRAAISEAAYTRRVEAAASRGAYIAASKGIDAVVSQLVASLTALTEHSGRVALNQGFLEERIAGLERQISILTSQLEGGSK